MGLQSMRQLSRVAQSSLALALFASRCAVAAWAAGCCQARCVPSVRASFACKASQDRPLPVQACVRFWARNSRSSVPMEQQTSSLVLALGGFSIAETEQSELPAPPAATGHARQARQVAAGTAALVDHARTIANRALERWQEAGSDMLEQEGEALASLCFALQAMLGPSTRLADADERNLFDLASALWVSGTAYIFHREGTAWLECCTSRAPCVGRQPASAVGRRRGRGGQRATRPHGQRPVCAGGRRQRRHPGLRAIRGLLQRRCAQLGGGRAAGEGRVVCAARHALLAAARGAGGQRGGGGGAQGGLCGQPVQPVHRGSQVLSRQQAAGGLWVLRGGRLVLAALLPGACPADCAGSTLFLPAVQWISAPTSALLLCCRLWPPIC